MLRLTTQLLASGSEERVPVLFVHGNVASSRFFEETLAALPLRDYLELWLADCVEHL
jgi:hypothetical protein